MNKLLERQIRKYLPEEIAEMPGISAFISAVNNSYHAYDKDSVLSGRAFKMSEEEYIEVNAQLQKELEVKKLSIEKLKTGIGEAGVEGFTMLGDDLLQIVDLLNSQISKSRQFEIELKASQELWQFALEGAGDGVWDYNFHTQKIFYSKRYKQMLGFDDNEFKNEPDEWLNRIHPDDLHLVMKTDQDYFYKKRENHQLEYRIRHKEGHYIWVLDRGMVVSRTENGLPARIIGTHTDITERKLAEQAIMLSEEKYRNILANMNLGLLEVDNNDLIQFANQSFCEMSGYKLDEILGQKAGSLFVTTEDENILNKKNELRKTGVSDAYELIVNNKKKELKWWLISGAPRYNDSGELVGSIGIHLDITDRKKLELELNEARVVAEESVKTKEAFLAKMSHEIRTPMNAIIGMGRQLEKTSLQDQQRVFLNTINLAADHLLTVINDILDISKIEAGKMDLEQVAFYIQELLKQVTRIMQPRAEEKGLELQVNIDDRMAPVLIGDPHRVNQVLLNLISNAIKFTERGMVRVHVRPLKKSHGSQVVEFSVKDTGIGINPEFLAEIFEKFSQEDRAVARKYGGTGLGMAITKEIVELMQGNIQISSKKDIGTEILINIPFKLGTVDDLPKLKIDFSNSSSLNGIKVLLAEDNEMNRLVATTILLDYGVLVTEVWNGAEAIATLKNEQFDLVLMDMQMPVMNGLQATEVIRRDLNLDIPIIALTANAVKGESERCFAAGMNGFISKPFEEHDLINAIARELELEHAEPKNTPVKNNVVPESRPLYSLDKLRLISGADEGFIRKMISLFLTTTPVTIREMQEAVQKNDLDAIRKLAHKVKPMIDSLSIVSLKEVVQELESMEDNVKKKKRTSDLVNVFVAVMQNLTADLERLK